MTNQKLIVLFILLLGFSCLTAQEKTKSSQEEEAIRNVIEGETAAIERCDYDAWSSHWAHEEYCYFSVTGFNWHWSMKGWEEISAWGKEATSNCNPEFAQERKKRDYTMAINGNMAFVTFLEDEGNESTRVLEKREGQWKLIRMGVILSAGFAAQERQAKLAAFEGKWVADLSTLKAEPEPEGWQILDFQFENEKTPTGIRLVHSRRWNDAAGTFKYTRRMELATASGKDELGLFVAGHSSQGWSHVNHGSAMLDDDGTLVQKPKKPNSDQLAEKSWMHETDDGNLQLKVETYDEEGKVDFQFSVALKRE